MNQIELPAALEEFLDEAEAEGEGGKGFVVEQKFYEAEHAKFKKWPPPALKAYNLFAEWAPLMVAVITFGIAGKIIWGAYVLERQSYNSDWVGFAFIPPFVLCIAVLIVVVIIAILPGETPAKIAERAEDPDRHCRLVLYNFIASIEEWMDRYNYAVKVSEMSLLPDSLSATVSSAHDQIQRALKYADKAVRLWQLRQEGKGFDDIFEPSVGLEFEELQEVLKHLEEVVSIDRLDTIGGQIRLELALLDVQLDLSAIPRI